MDTWIEFRDSTNVWRYVDYNRRLATSGFMSRQGLRKFLRNIQPDKTMEKRFQDMGDMLLPENNRANSKVTAE